MDCVTSVKTLCVAPVANIINLDCPQSLNPEIFL